MRYSSAFLSAKDMPEIGLIQIRKDEECNNCVLKDVIEEQVSGSKGLKAEQGDQLEILFITSYIHFMYY